MKLAPKLDLLSSLEYSSSTVALFSASTIAEVISTVKSMACNVLPKSRSGYSQGWRPFASRLSSSTCVEKDWQHGPLHSAASLFFTKLLATMHL